jgi:adenylosuccinate lyase
MKYENYLSPFSWRYGSPEMRKIWSEVNKRKLWREIWVVLAETQEEYGLVNQEQVLDLKDHMAEINVERALAIEAEIHHDLMAELKTFAEQAPIGGGVLHLGATSMDVEDNADVLRIRQSLDFVLMKLTELLKIIVSQVVEWADLPLMAFTHIQPAEPSTLGYRLGQYAQDLFVDWMLLSEVKRSLRGKGFKGAVGTSASYAELIGTERLEEFEAQLGKRLGLSFYTVTTQVYPRKQDYQVVSALAGLGGSLYKFAFDLRLLQSPPIGELSEPFGKKQVGSSAMPFKRNPINAEKINSLARMLAQMPRTAWDNAAHSLLERTLDDSANRRTMLPEAFLIVDELLSTASRIITGLQVNQIAIQANLRTYGPFAAIERVLMASVKAGADWQEMHERLRKHAVAAWETIQQGKENPLATLICQDEIIRNLLTEEKTRSLLDAPHHLGNAPQRARLLANHILYTLEQEPTNASG